MATVIYNCKRCKKGKRVEYQKGEHYGAYILAYGGGKPTEYGGDTANGLCPLCGKLMDYGILKGYVSDTPCDHRCTSARGHICECSCGGKNHGINA